MGSFSEKHMISMAVQLEKGRLWGGSNTDHEHNHFLPICPLPGFYSAVYVTSTFLFESHFEL